VAGVLWAIAAAIGFSLGHVAISKGIRTLGVGVGTAVMLTTGTLGVTAGALAVEGTGRLAGATLAGVLLFAGAGVIHFVSGWGFMNASTRLIGPSRMSAITGVTPLFAALLAIATLGESLNLLLWLGMAAVVAGTYLIATS
jgi:drug/metabolite transporter (DMT)-like permease